MVLFVYRQLARLCQNRSTLTRLSRKSTSCSRRHRTIEACTMVFGQTLRSDWRHSSVRGKKEKDEQEVKCACKRRSRLYCTSFCFHRHFESTLYWFHCDAVNYSNPLRCGRVIDKLVSRWFIQVTPKYDNVSQFNFKKSWFKPKIEHFFIPTGNRRHDVHGQRSDEFSLTIVLFCGIKNPWVKKWCFYNVDHEQVTPRSQSSETESEVVMVSPNSRSASQRLSILVKPFKFLRRKKRKKYFLTWYTT